MTNWFQFLASDEFAYLITFIVIGGAILFAYIENIIPLMGLVVITVLMSVLAVIVTAMATGDTEAFMRELFN